MYSFSALLLSKEFFYFMLMTLFTKDHLTGREAIITLAPNCTDYSPCWSPFSNSWRTVPFLPWGRGAVWNWNKQQLNINKLFVKQNNIWCNYVFLINPMFCFPFYFFFLWSHLLLKMLGTNILHVALFYSSKFS